MILKQKSDEELLAAEKEIRDERQRRQFQRDKESTRHLSDYVAAYMTDNMAMHVPYTDQQQNCIYRHMMAALSGFKPATMSDEKPGIKWQPIEDAPKDGTWVLLWYPERGAVFGAWDVPFFRWAAAKPGFDSRVTHFAYVRGPQ